MCPFFFSQFSYSDTPQYSTPSNLFAEGCLLAVAYEGREGRILTAASDSHIESVPNKETSFDSYV